MRNNKEFHVLEREENQLRGIEVDLMRVRCKLQTLWHSGNSSRPFFNTFRKDLKGNLFCFITTFTAFTDSYVS